jgi:hypothetical protein
MSHQDRRLPLPADYQFPTHGVDCDCPPCRNRFFDVHMAIAEQMTRGVVARVINRPYSTQTAYGWGV